ncbi:MAG: tetratricopeptide repeat protein [Cyclobacteriaceae bacterium]|nr:tetratricopeptide repeat protein [Cyclobacteriaceae bacterium HetDA_MAG_MS6]
MIKLLFISLTLSVGDSDSLWTLINRSSTLISKDSLFKAREVESLIPIEQLTDYQKTYLYYIKAFLEDNLDQNYSGAALHYTQALSFLAISGKRDVIVKAKMLKNLGVTYANLQLLDEALVFIDRALIETDKMKLKIRQVERPSLLYNFGRVQYRQDNLAFAIIKFEQCSKLAPQQLRVKAINMKGLCYLRLGRHDLAITTFLDILEGSTGSTKGHVLNNLGDCYIALTKYDSAKHYLFRALDHRQGFTWDRGRALFETYRSLGRLYQKLGDRDSALYYLKAAIPFHKVSYEYESDIEIFKEIEVLYEGISIDSAQHYRDSYQLARNELVMAKEELKAIQSELQTGELLAAFNRNMKLIEEETTRQKQKYIWALIGGIVLTLVLAFWLVRMYYRNRKAKLSVAREMEKILKS